MSRLIALAMLVLAVFWFTSCRDPSGQKVTPNAEPYLSDPNSVGFDISPLPDQGGTRRWMATYTDGGKTAKFIFEISSAKAMDAEPGFALDMSSGEGAIVAVTGSDASTMLPALAKALEAKHLPSRVNKASQLPFKYVVLGDHNSQATGGGFAPQPPGNWTVMKIFLGKGGEDEVFLNFNPLTRKGQFSEKDVDYGDAVVAELATVL